MFKNTTFRTGVCNLLERGEISDVSDLLKAIKSTTARRAGALLGYLFICAIQVRECPADTTRFDLSINDPACPMRVRIGQFEPSLVTGDIYDLMAADTMVLMMLTTIATGNITECITELFRRYAKDYTDLQVEHVLRQFKVTLDLLCEPGFMPCPRFTRLVLPRLKDTADSL